MLPTNSTPLPMNAPAAAPVAETTPASSPSIVPRTAPAHASPTLTGLTKFRGISLDMTREEVIAALPKGFGLHEISQQPTYIQFSVRASHADTPFADSCGAIIFARSNGRVRQLQFDGCYFNLQQDISEAHAVSLFQEHYATGALKRQIDENVKDNNAYEPGTRVITERGFVHELIAKHNGKLRTGEEITIVHRTVKWSRDGTTNRSLSITVERTDQTRLPKF
jgi:hypothetical protein